ncbi:ECF RNA polymerase sigma-E factor [Phycisphaerae bacterium RAS1]|nr:ECF RNA polymerase sigma-E factor [Phycisphaerae bacterium RAS1]
MLPGSDGDMSDLDKAVAGDPAALSELLARYGPQIGGEIRSQIGSVWQGSIDADDVMQVTYVEAFLQIRSLAARDEAAFVGWLRQIAKNNLRDAIKELERKKRPPPAGRVQMPNSDESCVALVDVLAVDSATPSRNAAAGEVRRAVLAALEQMPPDYAACVRLYDLAGRDIADVAREMNRSPGAVHMMRARAHDHLRTLLSAAGGIFSRA